MSDVVLDSSVFLAILKDEHCDESVLDKIEGAVMSIVNVAEVFAKISDLGIDRSPHVEVLFQLLGRIEPFTQVHARLSATLRSKSRRAGLSLGDRSCLALALDLGAEVYTADRAWLASHLGLTVHLIR